VATSIIVSIIKASKWKSTKCKLGAGRENRVSFLVLKREDRRRYRNYKRKHIQGKCA